MPISRKSRYVSDAYVNSLEEAWSEIVLGVLGPSYHLRKSRDARVDMAGEDWDAVHNDGRGHPLPLSLRVRSHLYADRYPHEITMRAYGPGQLKNWREKCELYKLQSPSASHLWFYGFGRLHLATRDGQSVLEVEPGSIEDYPWIVLSVALMRLRLPRTGQHDWGLPHRLRTNADPADSFAILRIADLVDAVGAGLVVDARRGHPGIAR